MKRPISLCGLAAWSPMLDETALGDEVDSREMAASKLELRGVECRSDGSVTGMIVNGADVPIKDVKLLVSHVWSWTHERHPGEDDPNRTSHVRIAGEIPANGSVLFSYSPHPALQMPADGKCRTTAAVQSFTEIGN